MKNLFFEIFKKKLRKYSEKNKMLNNLFFEKSKKNILKKLNCKNLFFESLKKIFRINCNFQNSDSVKNIFFVNKFTVINSSEDFFAKKATRTKFFVVKKKLFFEYCVKLKNTINAIYVNLTMFFPYNWFFML